MRALREEYAFALLLKIAKLKRRTYYYHVQQMHQPCKYAAVKEKMTTIFHETYESYGYRRMTIALEKEGFTFDRKTVARLMKELGLQVKKKTRGYRSFRGEVGQIADNHVQREFEATAPYQLWVTDVSMIPCEDGKLYLSTYLDAFNREIVGYALSQRPNFDLIAASFQHAIETSGVRKNDQIVIHSDQGWLYQIPRYQALLAPYEALQSMSRRGNCYDNALMESFFGLLKTECMYKQPFMSVAQATQAIEAYIHFYNTKRIKEKLNGMSPIEFRQAYEQQIA